MKRQFGVKPQAPSHHVHDLTAVASSGSGGPSFGNHALTVEEDGGVGHQDGDEKFNCLTGDQKSQRGIGTFVSFFIDCILYGATYKKLKDLFFFW